MLPRRRKLRAIFARLGKLFSAKPRRDVRLSASEFHRACKELAFWSVSDAGLSGPIEAFDGSVLHPAADGLFTIRMTLQDSFRRRSPADAANIILRSLDGLRILLLLDIDGRRFTYTTPHVNAGIRELCANFTNRTERTG